MLPLSFLGNGEVNLATLYAYLVGYKEQITEALNLLTMPAEFFDELKENLEGRTQEEACAAKLESVFQTMVNDAIANHPA